MQLNTHRKLGTIFSYRVILQELVPHLVLSTGTRCWLYVNKMLAQPILPAR